MKKNESEYFKLLRDPRWQKKRLEIMNTKGFKCEDCGDEKSELNVHHCYYEKDAKPWEYDDECYRVMCEKCHGEWHSLKRTIECSFSGKSVKEMEIIALVMEDFTEKELRQAAFIQATMPYGMEMFSLACTLNECIGRAVVDGYKRGMESVKK